MKSLAYLLFGLCIFTFLSCGEDEIEVPDDSIFRYDYFPLDVGYEWIYSVDSVLIIQGGSGNIVSNSFLREKVTELISDTDGERNYRLEISYKKDEISDWQVTGVKNISINDERVIKNEGNLPFIKLVFPATDGTRWDGNAFFDSDADFPVAADFMSVYKDWEYGISDGEQRTIGDNSYADVLDVTHIDEETFISRRYSIETYAKDFGLVERKMEIFDTQNGNESLPWLARAERGFQLTQTLVSFTKN